MVISLVLVTALFATSLYTGLVFSMGIAGPFGGFCVEATQMSGTEFTMVTREGKTAATGSQPLLYTEIGNAEVQELTLYKDLPVPNPLRKSGITGARFIVDTQQGFEEGDDPLSVGKAQLTFSSLETNYVQLQGAEVYESSGFESGRLNETFANEKLEFRADSAYLDRARARTHLMSVDTLNAENTSMRMDLLGPGRPRSQECYSRSTLSTFYDAAYGDNSEDWVDRVEFNRLDHDSGKSIDGYEDNTHRGTGAAPGGTYELISTVATNESRQQHTKAWADWNQDKAVNTSEIYDLGDCGDDGCTMANVIDVPEDAPTGQALLRVVQQANNPPSDDFYQDVNKGEVLDYSIDYGVVNHRRYDYVSANDSDEHISRVRFADIDNTSGATPDGENGYQDFTDRVAHVAPAEEIPLAVNTTSSRDQYVTVWIDWNANDLFEDWERTEVGRIPGTGSVAKRIDVPTFAKGGPSGMRVITSPNGYVTEPRDDIGDGQSVMYTVNVNNAYADSHEFDFVFADNRDTWISGVDVADLNDVDRRQTVVDFNWAFPDCRNQGVTELDSYFYPNDNISGSDADFHEDDGGGVDGYTPAGECFLRTDADGYTAIFSDPGAGDGEQSLELPYYPKRGDRIEYRHYVHRDGNDYGDFYFGRQDSNNYYKVRLDDTNSPSLALYKSEGGTEQVLDSATPDVPDTNFHEIEIDWGAGFADTSTIEVTFRNGADRGDTTTLRTYDDTFDSGGIGFGKANAGSTRSYAHLWDRVTVNGMTRAEKFDRVELFGQEGHEDRTYERTDVAPGEEYEMSVFAEGAEGVEVFATVFFDWNRNDYLGPDIATAFRFLDDFEYGYDDGVRRPPYQLVDNFADLDNPEYLPLEIDDFGQADDTYERLVTGYSWEYQDTLDECDSSASQQALIDHYFPNSQIDSSQDGQWGIQSGNGGDQPNVGECVLFTEGQDFDGTPNTIFSLPGGANAEDLSYYPKRGETLRWREAHFRGTDLMYLFGVQDDGTTDPDEFYGVYVEAFSSNDGDYSVPVEIRKYTGGIGGSYTTLASDSFTMNDQEWIDRDDEAIWEWEVDWGRSTSSDIEATLYRPDGTQAVSLGPVSDTSYDAGGIGHWSDRGSHSSFGVTYSNAGYYIDAYVASEGCSINPSYEGDTAGFSSQPDVTFGTSECALQGQKANSTMFSPDASGLENYPERGERVRYNFRPDATDSEAAFHFGVETKQNSYAVRTNLSASNDIAMERWEGGGSLELASASAGFTAGSWYEILVDWGGPSASDTINVTVYDSNGNQLVTFEGDDGRYNDGGIGFSKISGGDSYWDNVDVEQPQLYDRFEYENETVFENFGSDDQPFNSTVVDFNWALDDFGACEDPNDGSSQYVYRLDDFFIGDISDADSDMHENDGSGASNPPPGCVLRSDAGGGGSTNSPPQLDGASITSMPGGSQPSDLEYYPKRGDTIDFEHYWYQPGSNGPESHTFFGVQDESSGTPQTGYAFHVYAGSDEIALEKWENGDRVKREAVGAGTQSYSDTFHDFRIKWGTDANPDRIVGTYYRSDGTTFNVTMEDSDWDSGGVAFHKAQSGFEAYTMLWTYVEASGTGCVLGDEYRGDRDAFTAQSGVTFGTDCALRGDNGGSSIYSLEGDGLGDYPTQGDRVKYMFNSTGGAGEFSFGVQDENGDNRYRARVNPSNNELRLDKFVEGAGEFIAFDSSVPLNENEWYEIRLDWGTEITLSAHDPSTGDEIGSVSAIDREYTDGGIGFNRDTTGGNRTYWDNVTVENRYGVCSLEPYNRSGSDVNEFIAREYIDSENTCQLSSDSGSAKLISTTGLDAYPERGDNIRADYWIENPDTISKLLFGVQDRNNYYAVNVTDLPDGFALEKVEGGVKTTLDSTNLTGDIPEGSGTLYDLGPPAEYPRHDINIQWGGKQPGKDNVTNGTISARIFQYDETKWTGSWFPANDTTFDSGGIGFVKGSEAGDRLYWDDVRVDNCKTYGYRGDREYLYGQSNVVSTGKCALEAGPEATDNTIFTAGSFNPRDGKDEFTERGDTLRFDYRYERTQDENGTAGQFFFGPNPTRAGDTYGLQINPEADQNQFQLFRLCCGEVMNSVTKDIDLRPDVWYTVEIAWGRQGADDDEIVGRVFGPEGQIADISMNDGKFDQGDIGFRKVNGEGSRIWWDDVRVFEGESRFDLGSCTISGDSCKISGDILAPSNAQGGDVLMRTVLTEGGPALGPYDDVGTGEVVDYTLNVDTSQEPAPNESFAVTINTTNSPVDEGNPLNVTVDIESTKSSNDTQTITLGTDGTQRDSQDVTLQPGNTTTITLTWATEVGDAGDYQARVESEDDSDTEAVAVSSVNAYPSSSGDASFEWVERVEVINTTSSATELNDTSGQGAPDGYQNLTNLSAAVDQGGEYEIVVTAAGQENSTQYVSTWFDWNLNYDLDTREDVGTCNPTEPQNGGDYYTCEVNTTIDVPVDADPNGTRMRVIQEFDEWPDGPYQDDYFGQTVDYTADVQNVDFQPATYEVTVDTTNSPVVEGENLDVTATIENTGEEPGDQDIVLEAPNGTQRDVKTNVSLSGGESTTFNLTWTTQDGDAGSYDAYVKSDDDSDFANVTVEESATFNVSIASTNSPVEEGEILEVNADITNTGDNSGTKDAELYMNNSLEDTKSVSLSPGETKTVLLEWTTTTGDAGEYTALAGTEDDSDTTNVSVLEGPFFDVNITGTNSPVEAGSTLNTTVYVENTGGVEGTGDVILYNDTNQDGTLTQEDKVNLTLAGGENTTVTLGWDTTSSDVGDANVTVQSEDSNNNLWDEDETNVTIEESSFFDVTIYETNGPVTEGETLYVNATVENTGGQSDTQDIRLEINGTQEDVQTGVSLASGGSTNVSLNYTTVTGDYPAVEATVLSNDSSDSRTVEVMESRRIDNFDTGYTGRRIVDYDTNWGTCSDANALDQQPLSNYYYVGSGDTGDGEIRTGNGGNEPAIGGDCVLFWEGDAWSGNPAWIWTDPSLSLVSDRINYYPGPHDTIHQRAAYYRSTTQMFTFGRQSDTEFYAVRSETSDPSSGSPTITVELRKYYNGATNSDGLGDYDILDSASYTEDDSYWIDRDDTAVWDWYIYWHTNTDGVIEVEKINPAGTTRAFLSASDSEYGPGAIGHYSTDGSHTSGFTTYSNAGFDIDFEADNTCGIDRGNYDSFESEFSVYRGQSEVERSGCALQGYVNNTALWSFSGYSDYPQRGDKIRYWTRSSDATTGNEFLFGVQDVSNYYMLRFFPDNNEIRLDKVVGGSSNFLTWTTSANIQGGQWYEVVIDWGATQNDTVSIEVLDTNGNVVGTTEVIDTEFDTGGVGYQYDRFDGTGKTYWDSVRVETSR